MPTGDDAVMGFSQLTVSQALPNSSSWDPVLQEACFECPVHGEIMLPPQVVPILHTRPFARLKALKQLGICCLVFHSAEHSRQPHSMGVAALAFKMAESLGQRVDPRALGSLSAANVEPTDDEIAQVTLAGLAHDLGHGPFSHLWERCMNMQDDASAAQQPWSHEAMSLELLDLAVEEARADLSADHFLAQDYNIQAAKAMIAGDAVGAPPEKAWLYGIVNNKDSGLDVDKVDYVLRDQHQVFAADRKKSSHINPWALIEKALIVQGRSGASQIAFHMHQHVQEMLNSVFETRAAMHLDVYQRGPVLAYEEMILEFVRLLDPVFEWRKKSHNARSFLLLKDSILDRLDDFDSSHLPPDLQAQVQQAAFIRQQIDKGLGVRWLFKRSLPLELTQAVDSAADLKRMVHHAVCQPLQEQAQQHGRSTNITVRITRINEGKAGLKPVEKVPFYFYDKASRTLQSRPWSVREFRREHASNHNEASCSEKFFAHILWHKDRHDGELEESLELHGKQLFERFLQHGMAELMEKGGKRARGGAEPRDGQCKTARQGGKDSDSSAHASTEPVDAGTAQRAEHAYASQGAHRDTHDMVHDTDSETNLQATECEHDALLSPAR